MTSPIRPIPSTSGRESGSEPSDSPRIRILLVDDDELFRESLAMNLADEEFQVTECADGQACLDRLQESAAYDLVLLDWRMPGMSGIEAMQQIKAAGIDVPVVFLTAFTTERNEATALDCGAVDFLDKSRSASVLARRIRILVGNGRTAAPDNGGWMDVLRLGSLDIHFRTNRAYWDEQAVPLTTTEFRVVQLLASRAGEDVSYRAIYDVVHGRGFIAGDGSDGYRTNVRSMIKRIRQKFRELDDHFEEIENYPGFGYRWRPADEPSPQMHVPRAVNGHAMHGDGRYGDHAAVNGQVPSKVVDAISQLPFVRSVASWRRRQDPESAAADFPPIRLDQVIHQMNHRAPSVGPVGRPERVKVPAMTGHSSITGPGSEDTG